MAAKWAGVVADTIAIMHRPAFLDRLIVLGPLDAKQDVPTTGRQVAAAYLGDLPAPSQVPTQYVRTQDDPDCDHQTASTKPIDAGQGVWFARTTLNPCSIKRAQAKAGKPAAYACAINTAAHEMTHAVLTRGNQQLYQDSDHKRATTPLVSYTIGAVAQCLFLQAQGSLTDSMFESCLHQVGVTSFNPETCDESWLKTLRGVTPYVRSH